jgi:acyl carrier protein
MAVARADVIDQLHGIFDQVTDGRVDAKQIQESSHLYDDLGLTSLDLLELRFEMESTWNVTVSDEEGQQIRTVGDVIDLIVARAA